MPEPLKIFSLNCEADNHLDVIIPFVKNLNPDVICFQEVFEKDLEMLKQAFDMDGIFAPNATITTPNRYGLGPFGRWGITILTNLPIEDANYAYYKGSGDHIPEMIDGKPNSINRSLATMHVDKDGLIYVIATTHFTWSPDGETTEEQRHDFSQLLKLLDKTPEVILMGDFNAPRGKEIFSELSKRYVDNVPRDVTSSLDPNLHRVQGKDLVVDGLFTSPAYRAEDIRVVTGISDHKGITAQVVKLE